MHSGGHRPIFSAAPAIGHGPYDSSAPADIVHPLQHSVGRQPFQVPLNPPHANAVPVRVPLPKGFVSGESSVASKLNDGGLDAKKAGDKKRDAVKRAQPNQERLDRLEEYTIVTVR